jgi:hypothetical protein
MLAGSSSSSCSGMWNPVAAAGPQSGLSGVLAGFVFAGLVVVLSIKPSDSEAADFRRSAGASNRSYALQLLSAAFIVFALDSYFSSVTAGELDCNRAYAESILSGGVLGTGAIMLVASLSWLVVAYFDSSEEIRFLFAAIMAGVWIIVLSMLALSGMGEGPAILNNRNQVSVDSAPYIISAPAGGAVIVIIRRSRKFKDNDTGLSVLWAAIAALGMALASGLLDGLASGIPGSWWDNLPLWAVDLVVTLSVLIPEMALIASVVAAMAAVRSGQTPGETGGLFKKILSRNSLRNLIGLVDQKSSVVEGGVDRTAAS